MPFSAPGAAFSPSAEGGGGSAKPRFLNSSLAIKFLEYPLLLARFPPIDLRHGPLKT